MRTTLYPILDMFILLRAVAPVATLELLNKYIGESQKIWF
jgi:hypothetical protein